MQDVSRIEPNTKGPRAGLRFAEIPPASLSARCLAEESPSNHHLDANNSQHIAVTLAVPLRAALLLAINLPLHLPRLPNIHPTPTQPTHPPQRQRRTPTPPTSSHVATQLAADNCGREDDGRDRGRRNEAEDGKSADQGHVDGAAELRERERRSEVQDVGADQAHGCGKRVEEGEV